jgi:Ca2+-binding EF-hand superfamily protein
VKRGYVDIHLSSGTITQKGDRHEEEAISSSNSIIFRSIFSNLFILAHYLKFLSELKEDKETVMQELFNLCDEDKDGSISKEELKKIIKKMNLDITDSGFF